MDGSEAGAQVVAPVFFHNSLPGQFYDPSTKKRSSPWQPNIPAGFHQTQPNPTGNWNPNSWNWDSVRFAARPVPDTPADSQAALTLDLRGGGVYSGDRPAVPLAPVVNTSPGLVQERANKRVRSGSPGNKGVNGAGTGGYPMCQVDDCKADLSNAKDYHRRHKVCEAHSKTTKALVGDQMQRFCQQCSRFHPLGEFDEGKRSCRRRLAGHNRRRRKTQPNDVASQLLLPGTQEAISNANIDIVNILTALARLQGNNNNSNNNNGEKSGNNAAPISDRDGLIQIISQISSLNGNGNQQQARSPPQNSGGGGFDLNNTSEETNEDSFDQQQQNQQNTTVNQPSQIQSQIQKVNQNQSPSQIQSAAPPTRNLLEILTAAASLTASNPNNKNQQNVTSNSQASCDISSSSGNNNNNKNTKKSPPLNGGLGAAQLGLQLFGDESPPKVNSTTTTKYLSSESSNPMEEQSPSASPPITTHKFFPVHSAKEDATSRGSCQPFNMFKDLDNARIVEGNVNGNNNHNNAVYYHHPAAANSSSGSDHFPSTSNSSDAQDRTGRIVFKLFGRDPSSFPQNIRDQINNWLSSSPSSMESYIRPGCVVMSLYLSMPSFAWDELEENLLERVTSLVGSSDSDFWKNGRFLVRTNRQLVSHRDGMIRLSKSWRTWSSPEVTSVTPLAVVGGRETALVLKGRNLNVPGTKIYCTRMGKYLCKEVLCSAYPGTIYDDSSVETFNFPGDEYDSPFSLGRCFIEVENGFKGNGFPVIIASSPICEELRTLEAEFEITGQITGEENKRDEVLQFLNELGWLFQMEKGDGPQFSIQRFKQLLVFSAERDWCAITKTLLDLLAKRSLLDESVVEESLNSVEEIQLLNRAVRRKSRRMVDMLLHFTVNINNNNDANNNKIYLFNPSMAGPNGWTPLHLAASSDGSEDIIDALTDDPQQFGLRCWDSVKDESDQTPEMYASARNNHSYNELVMRKRLDRNNNQVSISVENEISSSSMDRSWVVQSQSSLQITRKAAGSKCCNCEVVQMKRPVRKGGLLGRPYVLSMLGIAAVCVCVCVFMRALIRVNSGRSLNWSKIEHGFM